MQASELDFDLPQDLIAQAPLAERDGARLAIIDQHEGLQEHARILDLPNAIRPSLIIVNDSKVLRARIFTKKPSGGKAELLLITSRDGNIECPHWRALARGTKSLKSGITLEAEGVSFRIHEVREGGEVDVEILPPSGESVRDAIARTGRMPLPPYIKRMADEADDARYQTIFAEDEGSIAAPTAGLHFTPTLVSALEAAGHRIARVTLHVGPGTFAPLRVENLDEHPMHSETYEVTAETAQAIADAKREGRPVLAVGTTSCRTLESAANDDGTVRVGSGSTALFIRPSYTFKVVDALLTNFHLPRSTLFALVMALAGKNANGEDVTRAAYEACVRERYRFFSYGDAMLIRKPSDKALIF